MLTTLLIPTLNERIGLEKILPRIKSTWVDQILIVDGQSTDGTADYARSLGYEVVVQSKKGMRNAYMEAMPYVKGDVIITFSPDGNSIPELIPALIDKVKEGYAMVIVSRYKNGAKSYDDDPITAFGNKLFTFLINVLYRAHYTDSMVIFRAYQKDIIWQLDLDMDYSYSLEEKLFKTNISWEPLMSIRAAKTNMDTAEIPGDEPPRLAGVRKLQVWKWGAAYLMQIFRNLLWSWKCSKSVTVHSV